MTLKYQKILGAAFAALLISLSVGTSTTLAAHPITAEGLVNATSPADQISAEIPKALVWTEIGTNNKLTLSYDEKGLQYDSTRGLITVWTRWDYLNKGPAGVKTIFLKTQYDVRLKTYMDEEKIIVDSNGFAAKVPVDDTYWNVISMSTMGEDIIKALNKYLLTR